MADRHYHHRGRAVIESDTQRNYHYKGLGIEEKKAAAAGGRIMSSLVNAGGLAGLGGIAGDGGGLAG